MKYTNFKNAYTCKLNLQGNLSSSQTALYLVQKAFDDAYSLFYYNESYTSALWYANLLEKFKTLIENNELEASDRTQNILDIYKSLYTRSRYYYIKENLFKMDTINTSSLYKKSA